MQNPDNNTVYSITAHIDLLGFSSHLTLSSYDLRTKIGAEAISRLKILESAVEYIEKEKTSYSNFYPETFRYMRFNDSLIFGVDINPPIIPGIGRPNEEASFTIKSLKSYFNTDSKQGGLTEKMEPHFSNEAIKIAQFLGIVSRVHGYINQEEYNMHMPGCRTIVSSGLRYKFIKNDNTEDFYSANFSLSNAYIVNDLGSKSGFEGNKCYVENNVVNICTYNKYVNIAVGYAKFVKSPISNDPYAGNPNIIINQGFTTIESKKIEVDLFNKRYVFREVNTGVLSLLQLFPHIINLIEDDNKRDDFTQKFFEDFKKAVPTLKEINEAESLISPAFKAPILC